MFAVLGVLVERKRSDQKMMSFVNLETRDRDVNDFALVVDKARGKIYGRAVAFAEEEK